MRNIPSALQTHLAQEVISLAKCLKITKNDGSVLRLTTHDRNLVVGGDTYRSDISLDTSAIQMTDDLSVDNMEVNVGIDDDALTKNMINNDLFQNAPFELFLVNWENVSDGVIHLKRGWVGDITIVNDTEAKFQLRGLTQALQRAIIEKYSPTCRTSLGSSRCGVVNIPTRVRRPRQRVKTYDWFVVPNTNVTDYSVPNGSFESDGAVANGTSGITGWTYGSGSYWQVTNTIGAPDGTYYLAGGNDGLGADTGTEFTLYKEITTATLGMANVDIDDGDFSIDLSALVAQTSSTAENPGRVAVECLDSNGNTLKRAESDYIIPNYQEWQGIGATAFVPPNTRTIKIILQCRKDEGTTATVGFDEVLLRYWTNVMATFGGAAFKVTRIPTFDAYDKLAMTNPNFTANGAVANSTSGITGWTYGSGDFWQVVASAGAVTPRIGGFMLRGGTGGTGDQTLSVTVNIPSSASATDIANGWYYGEFVVYAAQLDTGSDPRITLEFLDSSNVVLDTKDSGYTNLSAVETWQRLSVSGKAPANTAKLRATIYADAANPNVLYDETAIAFFATAFSGKSDSEYGLLDSDVPTLDYSDGAYSYDADGLVQAVPPVFGFAAVTGTGDSRTFNASAINETAAKLYSGKIVWLSGANAGKTSYIRIWNNTSKQVKLYTELYDTITVGDKFVYALGCDKTITTCAETFKNAHNFRGEPYIPGPNKVIEFLTRDTA